MAVYRKEEGSFPEATSTGLIKSILGEERKKQTAPSFISKSHSRYPHTHTQRTYTHVGTLRLPSVNAFYCIAFVKEGEGKKETRKIIPGYVTCPCPVYRVQPMPPVWSRCRRCACTRTYKDSSEVYKASVYNVGVFFAGVEGSKEYRAGRRVHSRA